LRYVYYLEGIYQRIARVPVILKLKALIINSVPSLSGGGIKPILEIEMG
jgi:hypothetical protein